MEFLTRYWRPLTLGLIFTLVLVLAVLVFVFGFPNRPSEEPQFSEKAMSAAWSDELADSVAALDGLAVSLQKIVRSEIEFYGRRMQGHRRFAFGLRLVAFAFGAAGLVTPLLAKLDQFCVFGCRPVDPNAGYVFLAIGAAALAANQLFGASESHIRARISAGQMEALLTAFSLSWAQWKSAALDKTDQDLKPGVAFALLEDLRAHVYLIITTDDRSWADDRRAQDAALAARLNAAQVTMHQRTQGKRKKSPA